MPETVYNNPGHASGVSRQSVTIVADNRMALPASLAVEYSGCFFSAALLAAPSDTLGLESVILQRPLRCGRAGLHE